MKRFISRLLSPMLILCMMCHVSVGCKSHNVPRMAQMDTDRYESHFLQRVDTIVVRDSVYRHDSVIYRERTIHDTVYITKEVYRDRLEARGERQKAVRVDTVVVTEYRDRVVEHPPERYIPPFYKHCTTILWIILAAGIVYIVCKTYIKFRL